MKLLREDYESILFDADDVAFVAQLTEPFATPKLSEASEKWNEQANERIELVSNGNEYVNVGWLNTSEKFINTVKKYLINKYNANVQFNNNGSIFWMYKRHKGE